MPAAKRQPSVAADTDVEATSSTSAPPSSRSASGSRGEGGVLPTARHVSDRGEVQRRRDDNDALTGHFATIVNGDLTGTRVVVGSATEYDEEGFPTKVYARTRDDRDEVIVVDYADLRPASSGGR